MRKAAALVILSGLLWPGTLWADGFDEVLLTQHNLFPGGSDALIRDVCQVCHVPLILYFIP